MKIRFVPININSLNINAMKSHRYSFFFLIFCLFLAFPTFAQRMIKGKIFDENNEPLLGASIAVKGASVGTVTNIDGEYSILVTDSTTVAVSFIGYITQIVTIKQDSILNFNLNVDTDKLTTCWVSLPFQTTYKSRQLIAKEYFHAKDFNKGNIHDPLQLLRGKVAGLEITRIGNNPNEPFSARIRGLNTLNGENKPTLLIDGMPYTSLNLLDPMDISGAEVFKDGAEYGIRGIQGVINFETIKAKNYSQGFTFNTALTTEGVSRLMPLLSPTEFVSAGGKDYDSKTDWRSLIFKKATTQVYNLAFAHNFKNTDIRLSTNYRNANGVLKNTGFEQLNGRLSLQQRLFNNRLVINVQAAATSRQSEFGFTEAIEYAHNMNPTAPIFDNTQTKNGGYFEVSNAFGTYNPLSIVEQNWQRGKTMAYTGNLNIDYNIANHFKANLLLMRENQDNTMGRFVSKTSYYGVYNSGEGSRFQGKTVNDYLKANLAYDNYFGNINIKAQGGYEFQKLKYNQNGIYSTDFDKNATTFDDLALGKRGSDSLPPVLRMKQHNHKIIGFYSNATLDYEQIYYLSLGVRYDGSSRFGVNNKWVAQPSVNAAIDFSKLLDLDNFSTLKLRGGYSTTSAAPFKPGMTEAEFYYDGKAAIWETQQSNPDLSAEMKREWHGGLDFAFGGERLYGSLDVYKNKVSDVLNQYNNIVFVTYGAIWLNAWSFQNKGIELTLRGTPLRNNGKLSFSWETGFTFNSNSTKLLSMENGYYNSGTKTADGKNEFYVGHAAWGCPEPIVQVKEGENIGNFRGLSFVGLNPQGIPLYKDVDGVAREYNDKINSNIIGNGLPNWTGAWSNSLKMKNFDMSFVLRGAFGHDLLNEYRSYYENYPSSFYNKVKTKYTQTNLAKFYNIIFSDFKLEKGRFVKLDNISVGYTFENLGKIKSLRLYFSADNLLVLTGYTGNDPEIRYSDTNYINSLNSNNLITGIDRKATSYPLSKMVTLGLNMKF
jgi:TonB-dependent starch-binding outer membrane protein SusC